MAKKKEEPKISGLSKRAMMMKMVEEEKKIAEKLGEPLTIGQPSDFEDKNKKAYRLTSILGIDLNIYGIKDGVVTTIWGESQAGKTTNSVGIIEGFQLTRPDLVVAYFDTEQTLDDNFLNRYPYLNQDNIFIFRETKIEYVIDKMRELVKENMVDLIIWDSYDTTVSKTTLEKSFEKDNQQVMGKATVLSQGMHEIQENMKKHGIAMIIVQQVKQKFNNRMQAYDGRAGGNTMMHAPSAVLKLTRSTSKDLSEIDDEGKPITNYVFIKNEKSKVSQPYKSTHTYINCDPAKGIAIDKMKEVVDYAMMYELIEGKGWYVFTDMNGEIQKVQGKDKILGFLKNNVDLYSHLKFQIYSRGLSPEMFISKFEEIVEMLEVENAKMKEKKIKILKAIRKEHLIDEKDTAEYKIDTEIFNPKSMIDEEVYDRAIFNMMTIEEQKKHIEKLDEETKKKLLKPKIVEAPIENEEEEY